MTTVRRATSRSVVIPKLVPVFTIESAVAAKVVSIGRIPMVLTRASRNEIAIATLAVDMLGRVNVVIPNVPKPPITFVAVVPGAC